MNRTFYRCRRGLCWLLAALCVWGLGGLFMLYSTAPADSDNLKTVEGSIAEIALHERPNRRPWISFTLFPQVFRVTYFKTDLAAQATAELKQAGAATVTFVTDWRLWHGKEAVALETAQGTFGSIAQYNAYQKRERVLGLLSLGILGGILLAMILVLLFVMYHQNRPKELRGFRGFWRCLFCSKQRMKRMRRRE